MLGALGMARRTTFYIDPKGTVVFIDSSVSTGTHGTDVVKKLVELGVSAAQRPIEAGP